MYYRFSGNKQIIQTCLVYISCIKSSIYFNWQEKIVIASLKNANSCEIAIRSLPFLFYKKNGQNIPVLFETIKTFDEITNILFVKNFRILMCAMYGKTVNQTNKITYQEELFCVDCDKNKVKPDIKIRSIDNKSLNEFWKLLLLSFVNSSNMEIKCEVIKNIPLVVNHFYPDDYFRNQMLSLINDKEEEVRFQCSKVLNSMIFEKDAAGNVQIVESYFSQMLNILCTTVNTSLKFGNVELQYTCLETIFNVGW